MTNQEINVPVLRTAYGTYVTLEDYFKLQQRINETIELVNNLRSDGTDIYEGTRQDILASLQDEKTMQRKREREL